MLVAAILDRGHTGNVPVCTGSFVRAELVPGSQDGGFDSVGSSQGPVWLQGQVMLRC